MSNNNNMDSHTKKRRVDDEGSRLLSSVDEDKLMQTLNQLLDSNRTQLAMMSRMQGEIKRLTNESNKLKLFMEDEIKGLKGEIIHLTEKCDRVDKSIVQTNDHCNQMKKSNQIIQVTQNTISENMNSRFDDVDNKQQYHEVLLRNQQWKYSAPRPSPEYWDSLDEDAVAEEFLTRIKKCTKEMRYGTGDGDIEICLGANLPYNGEIVPHWNEFANALEQYQYRLKCLPKNTDSMLCLADMELPNEVVEVLSNALESTHFTKLLLRGNSLGQSGIDFTLKYLQKNQIMKEFNLALNTIDNMKDIEQLCEIVEEHPSIERLALDGCRGERVDGYEMLQTIMSAGKNKLIGLDLSNNSISTGGDTFISDFLAGNPILFQLKLDGNQLDDNDARAIAGALKYNTKLRSIDVRNNNISKSGWEALRKAEFDDTSLNSAADSNHTCTIFYPSGDDEIQGFDAREMNGDIENSVSLPPVHVRPRKVYAVLSSNNGECSNVGHFDDVPVELLPDMLSTIQQYSEYHTEDPHISQDLHDVNPLSIVYEVCRYWEKSLAVYELLSL